MARKRKRKAVSGHNVVNLDAKRSEKLTDELMALGRRAASLLDQTVRHIVAAYNQWERKNPELALRGSTKMAMVRLGFIGPGGFDRCHETGRRPGARSSLETVKSSTFSRTTARGPRS